MSITRASLLGDTFGSSASGTIPAGGIIMWSGSSVPTGWALCNGQNGTPDLRNRFIVGAHSGTGDGITTTPGPDFGTTTGTLTSNYTPGNFGGRVAHRLTVAELAEHFHYVPTPGGASGLSDTATTVAANYDYLPAMPTSSSGSNNYHENRPPYYALAFIMKIA